METGNALSPQATALLEALRTTAANAAAARKKGYAIVGFDERIPADVRRAADELRDAGMDVRTSVGRFQNTVQLADYVVTA